MQSIDHDNDDTSYIKSLNKSLDYGYKGRLLNCNSNGSKDFMPQFGQDDNIN